MPALAALLVLPAAAARAQDTGAFQDEPAPPADPLAAGEEPAPPPPPPRWAIGARLGVFDMTNSPDSYDAVFGDPMPRLGAQLELDVRRHLRFDLTLDYGFVDGEQVILTDPPSGTGVGETLTLVPLHLTAAWRLRPAAPWDVYLGLGPSWVSWQDEVDGGGSESGSGVGGSLLAGVRRQGAGRWDLGGELRWSSFPGALPDDGGGVTELYGEDDPGGLSLSFVALRRLR